jgi:lactate permease
VLAALALLPLLLFVVLLVGLRLSAAWAGLAGAIAGLAVAVFAFGYPVGMLSLAGPAAEALFTAATIVWIVFPALAIYEFQKRTGATDAIGRWLGSVSGRPQTRILLVAWFFALFLEGAAGFGTPVALVAPMLVALGLDPLKALVLALLGHAAGVSFGAVGTPVVPLLAAVAVDPRLLSLLTVGLNAAVGWALAALLFSAAAPDRTEERASWLWPMAAALLFFVPAAALAWFAGPELPTLGGALVGGVLFAALLRWRLAAAGDAAAEPAGRVWLAMLPYLLVLALILVTRLVPANAAWLQDIRIAWTLGDDFAGAMAPLYHPGTMLMLALLLAAALVRPGRGALATSLSEAARRMPPVILALVAVLLLARLMVHGGMIEALARSAAGALGANWPVAAPLVGALGSLVTGSATASNIILGDFQVAAAAAAGLAPLLPLAGQGFGAGIGNIVAPHNIVAGAATVGLVGREGEVLRRTIPICLACAAAGGAILLAAQRLV